MADVGGAERMNAFPTDENVHHLFIHVFDVSPKSRQTHELTNCEQTMNAIDLSK
jgi:hypothetical protein